MLTTGRSVTAPFQHRIALAGAGLLLALTPVACGGNPEPTPVDTASKEPTSESPSASETPTPSPSASATASSVEEELEAATVAFYAAVTEAYETLDPAPIEAVIVPNSRAGGAYLNRISDMQAEKRRYSRAPEFTVESFKLEPQDAESQFEVVTFTLTSGGSTTVDSNGKTVEDNPPGSAKGRIEFMKKGEKWLVLSQRFED
jgi:hypothetical protein